VSRYQKSKTNPDFTEARDSEWQWHQPGHMQVCTSLQTDNHASTPPLLEFFTGRMPFLPPNQQRQSTEGRKSLQKQTTIPLNKHISCIHGNDTISSHSTEPTSNACEKPMLMSHTVPYILLLLLHPFNDLFSRTTG